LRVARKRKLYPKVSPGKTLEGGIGGLVSAVAMAFFIREVWQVPIQWQHAATLGVLGGLFGTLGDLCESLLKRSVGAKDSSHIIPGHGGVLDRFDGVMFAVPAFYIYITLFQP
jgi:phosphatidate cytidylyltransferase